MVLQYITKCDLHFYCNVKLLFPSLSFFFLTNRRTMLGHCDCTAVTPACSHKLEFNDFHVCTSHLLSGPDTTCSISQANLVG